MMSSHSFWANNYSCITFYLSDGGPSLETSGDAEDESFYGVGKQKPKHNWYSIKALTQRSVISCTCILIILEKNYYFRSLGMSNHKNMENVFNSKCYGSLRFVQRLELAYKMDCHNGCVNALHFNSNGSRLASGSDDLSIIIWDWSRAQPVVTYDSGHRGNVFQVYTLVAV